VNTHEDRARDFLLHMIDALDQIAEYTTGISEEQFLSSRLIQDAVVRNIGIVGEAAKQLYDVAPEFSEKHPEIPFVQVYGMRNRVIHGYASVNPVTVWGVVLTDAPELRRQIAAILEALRDGPNSG
jgi:uncharacterized protein with HEPN domain